jgi:putative exosortase-associated protein (TIGR04073 family)
MFITLALGILLAMMLPETAAAQEAGDTAAKIGLKAFRGLGNTVLGLVTEIPRTMYYDSRTEGPTYGLTVGFLEGIALGLGRTAVGVYELVTFPIPFPEEYRPVLAPGDPFGEGKTTWAR